MNTVWIVEMLCESEWVPTVGVAMNRVDGREVLSYWREKNPRDRFRLTRYSPFTTSGDKEGR